MNRTQTELGLAGLISVLGALLVCGALQLAKGPEPKETLTASAQRIFLHNRIPIPVPLPALVPTLAALPGVIAFGVVLGRQRSRRKS